MTRIVLSGLAVLLTAAVSLAAGCSLVEVPDPTFDEGTQLEITDYGLALPASRAGYAAMATFVTSGTVQIIDPGTGPTDPPRLLRTIRIENHTTTDAQIADDGYLWVATPDDSGGPLRVMYVVDPHSGRVHRSIRLPTEVRAVGNLTVGPEDVYLRSWRDGFSGGVGAISRGCASEDRACDVRLLAELGNVGGPPERALHYRGDALYSFSGANSRDERYSTARLNTQTGEEIVSTPISGTSTFDDDDFYVLVLRGPGRLALVRFDQATLREEDSQDVDQSVFQIAYDDGKVYVTNGFAPTVEVYDAASLEPVETIDVSAAGRNEAAVGFLAPGVLVLNRHAWLNTETGQVVADAFPVQEGFSLSLRLPQGHPLAW